MEKGKGQRKLWLCFLAVGLLMGLLINVSSSSMAKGQIVGKKDVKVQIRKDAEEVGKNDEGKTRYIIYHKNARDGKKVKVKYQSKCQKENEKMWRSMAKRILP